MCPPAAASRDEWLTTRARANAAAGRRSAGAVPLDRARRGRVRGRAGHLRGLQGLQRGVPGGGRHGGPEGRVAGRGARPQRRAAPGPRHRPTSARSARAGGAGRAARERAAGAAAPAPSCRSLGVAHAAGAGHRPASLCGRSRAGCDPPRRRRRAPRAARGAMSSSSPTASSQYQEPHIGEALLAPVARGRRTRREVVERRLLRPHGALGRADRQGAAARRERAVTGARAHAGPGVPIVFIEPSCQAMVLRRLVPAAARRRRAPPWPRRRAPPGLRGRRTPRPARCASRGGGRALVHPHCHERAVFGADDTRARAALRARPRRCTCSTPVVAACRASSATQAERYELSVASPSAPCCRPCARRRPATAVLATGTSCRSQIARSRRPPGRHPLTARRAAPGLTRTGAAERHRSALALQAFARRRAHRLCADGGHVDASRGAQRPSATKR